MAELVGLPVKGTLECDELVLTWFKGLDGVAVALAGVRVREVMSRGRGPRGGDRGRRALM